MKISPYSLILVGSLFFSLGLNMVYYNTNKQLITKIHKMENEELNKLLKRILEKMIHDQQNKDKNLT